MSEISEKVRSVVAKELGLASWIIKDETTLRSLGADSLEAIGLIMAVEMTFGRSLPEEMLGSLGNNGGDIQFETFAAAVERALLEAPQRAG